MATLTVVDINDRNKIVRGSIGTITGVTTAITWFDLGNPGAIFPFQSRLGGANLFAVSVEGTFSATIQIVLSEQDSTPASTPAGASALAVPILGSSLTVPTLTSINEPVRWIGLNCSVFASGSATGWVYGVLPS